MPRIFLLLVCCLAVALPVRAVTPAVLIGEDLQPQSVDLQGVRDGQLLYFGSDRELRTESLDRFLQIRDLPGSKIQVTPGMIALTDGQRFAGSWVGITDDGQSVRWRHTRFEELTFPLDRVRAIAFSVPLDTADLPAADIVQMVNGDQLEGFVTAFTPDAVTFQPNGSDQPISLSIERLAVVRLANPPVMPDRNAHRVFLNDGSRIDQTTLTIVRDTIELTVAGRTREYTPNFISRIDIASTRGRLVDLTELPLTIVSGGEVFGVPMPPVIDNGQLRLHAPVTVRFELPVGAARLTATAALDLDADDNARHWADVELILRAGQRIILRQHLNADQPSAAINTPLTERELTLELNPAVNGPILDRLLLQHPLLFIQHQTSP